MSKKSYWLTTALAFVIITVAARLLIKVIWDATYDWATCSLIGLLGTMIVIGLVSIVDGGASGRLDRTLVGWGILGTLVFLAGGLAWLAYGFVSHLG